MALFPIKVGEVRACIMRWLSACTRPWHIPQYELSGNEFVAYVLLERGEERAGAVQEQRVFSSHCLGKASGRGIAIRVWRRSAFVHL